MYGIITSFIRIVLLNPMTLLGVVGGAYGLYHYRIEGLLYFCKSPYLYGALFLIALVYALLFKHVYHTNSKRIDWWQTIKSSVNHMLTMIIAAVLTCVIILSADYAFGGEFTTSLDQYLRHQK